MAARKENDQQGEKDRRAALLALASQEERSDTPCLDDGQMALLVSGECDDEERHRWQRHLTGCETCLRRWILLSGLEERPLVLASGSRNRWRLMGWAGSLLAAAASVVVFMQLTTNGLRQPLSSSPVPVDSAGTERKTVTAASSENRGPQTKADKSVRPAPEPALAPPPARRKMMEAARVPRQAGRPAPVRPEEAAMEMAAADTAMAPASPSPRLLAWQKALEQGCRTRPGDRGFWQLRLEEGRSLAGRGEAEPVLADLLEQVQGLAAGTADSPLLCQQLLNRINSLPENIRHRGDRGDAAGNKSTDNESR